MSKRSRRYLIIILVFVLFFDSILIGMYLMIDAKGDKTENQNRMGMGKVEQKVESVKVTKQEKENSLLVLVNKDNKMPEDFHLPLVRLKNGKFVAEKMYASLRAMWFDCERENPGYSIVVSSAYRSHAKQSKLLQEEIQKNERLGMSPKAAKKDALRTVAPPGFSEHQTGLCVDITAKNFQLLNRTQENTPENKWLQKHCKDYGFVLRYPKGRETVTGYSYEPWHFRYVGKKAAKEITRRGITLEEYVREQ